MTDTRTPDRSVSRRTLAKGAAWSVPTVALAATAPALASSIQVPPTFAYRGAGKIPGGSCAPTWLKGYVFNFEVCNNSPVDIWIYNATYSISGSSKGFVPNPGQFPMLIPANQCRPVGFNANAEGNSSNEVFTATLTVYWRHTQDASDPHVHNPVVVVQSVNGTPPVASCADPTRSSSSSSSSSSTSSSSSSSAAPASTSAPASTQASAPTQAPAPAAPAPQAPTSTAAPSGS